MILTLTYTVWYIYIHTQFSCFWWLNVCILRWVKRWKMESGESASRSLLLFESKRRNRQPCGWFSARNFRCRYLRGRRLSVLRTTIHFSSLSRAQVVMIKVLREYYYLILSRWRLLFLTVTFLGETVRIGPVKNSIAISSGRGPGSGRCSQEKCLSSWGERLLWSGTLSLLIIQAGCGAETSGLVQELFLIAARELGSVKPLQKPLWLKTTVESVSLNISLSILLL